MEGGFSRTSGLERSVDTIQHDDVQARCELGGKSFQELEEPVYGCSLLII
jgi:hypothetical protein